MKEVLKLLPVTTLLTVLIWISADSLVTKNQQFEVRVTFEPSADAPDMIVRPAESFFCTIDAVGSRNVIDLLGSRPSLKASLRLRDQQDGAIRIPLREYLREQWPEASRLTILNVTPSEVEITIDHWETRRVQLQKRPSRFNFVAAPNLEISEVNVRIPRARIRELEAAGIPLVAEVDIDTALEGRPSGERVEFLAPIKVDHLGQDVRADPSVVPGWATKRDDTEQFAVSAIPILIGVSVTNVGRSFKITNQNGGMVQRLMEIKVEGPRDQIEKLRSGSTYVAAWIQLKESDLDSLGKQKSYEPVFTGLPDGVKIVDRVEPIVLIIQSE